MTTHREIVNELSLSAAAGESVVLATVVRVTGSSYGGVGARMIVRCDGSTVGLVSGGCLESDLAEHARRVQTNARAEVITYDTREDDDAPWGLGLGCNGLIEVLLEPLTPVRAAEMAVMLDHALTADGQSVIATVIRAADGIGDTPTIGSHALFGARTQCMGDWNTNGMLEATRHHVPEALANGRRGLVREIGAVEIAFEVVNPAIMLIVCGAGPDAAPVVRFATQLGWDVTLVDHRRITGAHAHRFPGARVVECTEPPNLASSVALTSRSAAVVMSHHFPRDRDYAHALLGSAVVYVGVLGPRARTERMLAEFASDATTCVRGDERLFSPVGMDIGGEGPDAIALSIISQISAVMNDRVGGHLRDRRASLHAASSRTSTSQQEFASI